MIAAAMLFLMEPAPTHYPTLVEVDTIALSSMSAKGGSDLDVALLYNAVYPGIVRGLRAAGVRIATPDSQEDREILDAVAIAYDDYGDAAELRVRVSAQDFLSFTYALNIEVTRPDGRIAAIPTLVCGPYCNDNIDAFMAEHAARILPLVETRPPADTDTHAVVDAVGTVRPRGTRLESLGYVGAAVGLAGVGMAVFGGVSMGLGKGEWQLSDNQLHIEERKNYRSWKTDVVLYTGLGAIALGTVMLAVDLTDAEKRQRRRKVSAAPAAGFGFAGLSAWGRF